MNGLVKTAERARDRWARTRLKLPNEEYFALERSEIGTQEKRQCNGARVKQTVPIEIEQKRQSAIACLYRLHGRYPCLDIYVFDIVLELRRDYGIG